MKRKQKKEILKIYNEYLKGSTQKQLNKKYKTDTYYHFKKYNLKCRTTGESVQKFRHLQGGRLKLNYLFNSIKNETEAYIIGLFLSDGCVTKGVIQFKFNKKDIELLNIIRNYVCKDLKLYKDKNSLILKICSKKCVENLKKLNIPIKEKTKCQINIPKMNDNLLRHFIRGYFDGDGTVFLCNKNNKNKSTVLKSNICSPTNGILLKIQNILFNYKIESILNCEIRIGKELKIPGSTCIAKQNMYRLYIRKKSELFKFYNFLYLDSKIYLTRKFNIFNNNKQCFVYKYKYANTEVTV